MPYTLPAPTLSLPPCCSTCLGLQVQAGWGEHLEALGAWVLRPQILGMPQFPRDHHDEDGALCPPFVQNPGALAQLELRGLLKAALSSHLVSHHLSWHGEGDVGPLPQSVSRACPGLWTQAEASEPLGRGGGYQRMPLSPRPAHLSLPPSLVFL